MPLRGQEAAPFPDPLEMSKRSAGLDRAGERRGVKRRGEERRGEERKESTTKERRGKRAPQRRGEENIAHVAAPLHAHEIYSSLRVS